MSEFDLVVGENGTLAYSSEAVKDPVLSLFFSLVRNTDVNNLTTLLIECFESVNKSEEVFQSVLVDLFVLMFQTRDCRGGKGEKLLFYQLILLIHELFPVTTSSMLPLIAEFGSFKDFFMIDHMIHSFSMESGFFLKRSYILL